MNAAYDLDRHEAEWLRALSEVRSMSAAEVGIPPHTLESLLRKGLVVARKGSIEITTRGMAEVLRRSTPDAPPPRLHPRKSFWSPPQASA